MVRTKADASTRVAAGGKAPKKTGNKPMSNYSTSPSEKVGKDNLPVNRACPRETPTWQKKITFFYDKNATSSSSSGISKNVMNNNYVMEEENSNVLVSSKVDEYESMETD